jgi:hypothetical protein
MPAGEPLELDGLLPSCGTYARLVLASPSPGQAGT